MLPQVNRWVEFVVLAFVKVIGHVPGEAAIFFFLSQVASELVGKSKNTHTHTQTTLLDLHICFVMVV